MKASNGFIFGAAHRDVGRRAHDHVYPSGGLSRYRWLILGENIVDVLLAVRKAVPSIVFPEQLPTVPGELLLARHLSLRLCGKMSIVGQCWLDNRDQSNMLSLVSTTRHPEWRVAAKDE